MPHRRQKKISHTFVRLLDEDSDTKIENALLSLQCLDEKKVQIQMSKEAVVLEVGTLLKQNELFRKGSYLRDAACLIDEVVKFRKPKKINTIGVYPQFALPFSSKVAPDHLRELMFTTFEEDLGLPKVDQIEQFTFVAKTRHNAITVESEFKTSTGRENVLAFFDIRSGDPALVKSYDRFLLKAKPLYESVCKGIIQKLIARDGIRESFLTENKE